MKNFQRLKISADSADLFCTTNSGNQWKVQISNLTSTAFYLKDNNRGHVI